MIQHSRPAPLVLLFLSSLLLVSSFAASVYAEQPFVRKSDSSVTETVGPQGQVVTIVNSTFTFDTRYIRKLKRTQDVLLAQKIESTSFSGMEGAKCKLEVVAWISGKEKFDTKLWTITDDSDKGGRWGDFYRTTKYGCCGAENTHRMYSFSTGDYVFSYTSNLVSADIPNTTIRRNISYISVNAASDYEYQKSFPKGVGALTLSTNDSTIDRIVVETDNEDLEIEWSPELSLVNGKEPDGTTRLSLWHSNGVSKSEAVCEFSVKITFYEGMEILVPVNKDRFDIQRAVVPKSVSIRRIAQTEEQ